MNIKGRQTLKKKIPPPKPQTNMSKNTNNSYYLDSILNGMAFGTGNSIAHKTIDTIMNTNINKPKQDIELCKNIRNLYQECVKSQYNCQEHLDILTKYNC